MKRTMKNQERQIARMGAVMAMFVFFMATVPGCHDKTPIKVGFVGCLTGRLSDLGTMGRNGVMLAVEQVNEAGGIKGRPVELVIRDDQHDPDVALQVDKELIEAGVAAIIGHMTSTMSLAAVPLMNSEKMLMISPTTSTDKLAGIDDYFLRIMPTSKMAIENLAHYIFETLELRDLIVVYDLSNPAYTEAWYHDFTSAFESMGNASIVAETFTSDADAYYPEMAQNLIDSGAEGVVIVAGALDAAMICQQLRKSGSDLPIFVSGWAKTPAFLQHGGSVVEGVIFSQLFDSASTHKNYLLFKEQFGERFQKDPDFAAAFGYDAAQILLTALSAGHSGLAVKEAIINHTFQGLHGDITIDSYGDTGPRRILVTVKNGQFITME